MDPRLLLHSQIPLPMHGVNPRSVLGNAWWGREKTSVLSTQLGVCAACGEHLLSKTLDVHECYDIDFENGRMTYVKAVGLCRKCHDFIHRRRLAELVCRHKQTMSYYKSVIDHGLDVLENAGLVEEFWAFDFNEAMDSAAEWSQWRLVINGKEYPPKYSSEHEWVSGIVQ